MGMFDNAKQLYQLQKQARDMQKELKKLEIEAEEDGVLVVVNGAQEIVDVKIPETLMQPGNSDRVGRAVKDALDRAIKKAQEVAAEKMKPFMGGLMGGLGGGQ